MNPSNNGDGVWQCLDVTKHARHEYSCYNCFQRAASRSGVTRRTRYISQYLINTRAAR